MPTIGFVIPNYPGEKRVALLPCDIKAVKEKIVFSDVVIEEGFGAQMLIPDSEYALAGCRIASRQECFEQSHLFSLKLLQSSDYKSLKAGQKIIGWMHPFGSGKLFFNTIACPLGLQIFDIDSVYPRIFAGSGLVTDVIGLPPHFFWKNSYFAGMASVKLAFEYLNIDPSRLRDVAVLGSGSVSQGAFHYLSLNRIEPRMFYRKTLPIFYQSLAQYELVVNGIEMDTDEFHILSRKQIESMHQDVILIDAADAGRAIEGTQYLNLENPVDEVFGRRYTLVNNAPTLIFKRASKVISKVVSSLFLTRDYFETRS